MTISRVAVTGGNGKIGRAILAHLDEYGYETVNVARGKRREEVSDRYVTTDLLNAGDTFGALADVDADAVIHMGTIPGPGNHPPHRTYESNVLSSMHILEAAESLGLKACCLASSINAMGAEHQRRDPQVEYIPVDENHPRTPDDEYGIAKHAVEVTADGFGRRPDNKLTISTLRYPWVPTQRELEESFVEADRSMPALRTDDPWSNEQVLFSYLHIEDACSIARNAVEADFDGHESFWAVAPDTTAAVPSSMLVAEFFPEVEVLGTLDDYEALFDLSKAKELLGWHPQRTWRTQTT